MNFNFDQEQSYVASSQQYLKAYTINEVTLTKIEKTTLQGSKDPNASYDVIALEFTGTDKNPGVFSTNLFIPSSDEDAKRPTFKNAQGHEYERPSRAENFQYTLMQLMQVLNPEGAKAALAKLQGKNVGVDTFIQLVIGTIKKKPNVKTNLKLIGRNVNGTVYAQLPNACGLNKEGKLFPINFVGDTLFFSAYEEQQSKAVKDAKPTPVAEDSAKEDEDIDDLLADI